MKDHKEKKLPKRRVLSIEDRLEVGGVITDGVPRRSNRLSQGSQNGDIPSTPPFACFGGVHSGDDDDDDDGDDESDDDDDRNDDDEDDDDDDDWK